MDFLCVSSPFSNSPTLPLSPFFLIFFLFGPSEILINNCILCKYLSALFSHKCYLLPPGHTPFLRIFIPLGFVVLSMLLLSVVFVLLAPRRGSAKCWKAETFCCRCVVWSFMSFHIYSAAFCIIGNPLVSQNIKKKKKCGSTKSFQKPPK